MPRTSPITEADWEDREVGAPQHWSVADVKGECGEFCCGCGRWVKESPCPNCKALLTTCCALESVQTPNGFIPPQHVAKGA